MVNFFKCMQPTKFESRSIDADVNMYDRLNHMHCDIGVETF